MTITVHFASLSINMRKLKSEVSSMNYGEKLKELREYSNIEKRISQKEIADAIGIKRSAYNQFEQQYDIIPTKRLIQVADFFNVSIDYILGLSKDKLYSELESGINIDINRKRLKEFRKEHKLTQAKLAEVLKVDQSVVSNFERGRNLIATPFLYDLCTKYNLSADYLLGRINYNPLNSNI